MKDHSYGCKEFGYFSLVDSASIWEVNVAHCWKLLPLELATWIEYKWNSGAKVAQMKDYIIVGVDAGLFDYNGAHC